MRALLLLALVAQYSIACAGLVVLGHHASIPLALAILWSDYRFALPY
jgi:hypothetical protein